MTFGIQRLEGNRGRARNVQSEGQFVKCPYCAVTLFVNELSRNLEVCKECNHHFPMTAQRRIAATVDPETFQPMFQDLISVDPLNFTANRSYAERLLEARKKVGLNDAILAGRAEIHGFACAIGATDCTFMMGSMGSLVGEAITRLVEYATEHGLPAIVVSGSGGGARMDEGILSLMQMAKTSAAIGRHQAAGRPFISVLTDPTFGGVSASFAMLGDVIMAEPRARVGFAGPRVIRQTTNIELPPGFQEAGFLKTHGQIDMIVERKDIPATLAKLICYMTDKPLREGLQKAPPSAVSA
ncbi:MAG: acetyl-CoA carboxylase, carboxyltransferase subunit beta [Planctomycetota bacterium]